MKNKFFVTITAPNREKFFTLHTFDVDLLIPTTKVKDRKSPTIDAILTQEEVKKLVEAGFSVDIKEDASKRQSQEKVSDNFKDWLKEMQDRKEIS
jgi:hypothetical protein